MTDITMTFDDIKTEYDNFIDSCAKFNFFTRSERIQKEKISECEKYIQLIKSYKVQAIHNNNERVANLLFHFQCMLNAMLSSLKVWVALKSVDYHSAWSNLIDAQEYIEVALKIADYEGIRSMENQLKAMEVALFPGWALYNSPGYTETIGKCSICGNAFTKCEHIENYIYMGQLCQRVDRKPLEVDHSALVKNPKDRRCIVTKVSGDSGKMIDYFTWEETSDTKGDGEGMHVEGVILSFNSLDFN